MEPSRSSHSSRSNHNVEARPERAPAEAQTDFQYVVLTTADRRSAVVRLQGELDLAGWSRFDAALRHTIDEVQTLVFDLRDLTFVDVRTVERWLDAAGVLAERRGRLVLRHARPVVRDLVHRLGARAPVVVEPGVARIATAVPGYTS